MTVDTNSLRYLPRLPSTNCDLPFANNDRSSRKRGVLAHFTIHMVEIIQLYTDQPYMWLKHGHHPSSSVFQPHVWLDTISNSLNLRNEPHHG